jgi:hypothetical protein
MIQLLNCDTYEITFFFMHMKRFIIYSIRYKKILQGKKIFYEGKKFYGEKKKFKINE